jgi:hypothetical protein
MSTVSMQELELETAELLPSRETLCVPSCYHKSSGVSVTQFNASSNGNGDGNHSLLGGWFDGNLSGNNISIL